MNIFNTTMHQHATSITSAASRWHVCHPCPPNGTARVACMLGMAVGSSRAPEANEKHMRGWSMRTKFSFRLSRKQRKLCYLMIDCSESSNLYYFTMPRSG